MLHTIKHTVYYTIYYFILYAQTYLSILFNFNINIFNINQNNSSLVSNPRLVSMTLLENIIYSAN